MRKFVKGREIEAADTPFKIAKLNTLEKANHVAASEIYIGFEAKSTLNQKLSSSNPRIMVAQPENVVSKFQQVFAKLIEKKLKTSY